MRLIDADNLKIPNDAPYKASVKRVVAQQPTVEAKPVVKGEWKYDWLGEYICSNCYERVTVKEVMGEPAWDWCPACGADMRGGKND
jgi:hypothetical protein